MNWEQPKKKRNQLFIIIATVVLLIGAVIIGVLVVGGNNQGYRTINVVEVYGKVGVVKNNIEYSAYPGMLLQEGHEIITSGDSYVRLVLDGDKYVKLEAGSKLMFETLGTLGSGKTKLCLERGSLSTELTKPLKVDEQYVVNTPNAVLAVRGTFFRVELQTAENGEVIADVLTYGGQVASQRIMPTGAIVEEEVLINAGYKASIAMSEQTTRYIVEAEDGEQQNVDLPENSDSDTASRECTRPIEIQEISNDDLVDIYFAAKNGHELFATTSDIKEDIVRREIALEEKTSVYDMAQELSDAVPEVVVDDSRPLVADEVTDEEEVQEVVQSQVMLTDGSAHIHEEVTEEIPATCTEAGEVIVSCASCNKVLERRELPITGHSYGDWETESAATCTTVGSVSRHCTNAGCDSRTEMMEVPIADHSYGDWEAEKTATCTEAGSRERICSACGDVATEELPATGHSYAEEFAIDTEATCTTVGSQSKHCTNAGCSSKTDITEIPVIAHSYGEWQEKVAAACETTGSRERTCSACGDIATEEIPALGHSYAEEFTIDTVATCTTFGSQSKHCANADCDSKTDVTEIPMIAHSYGEWQEMVAASCETAGSKERTCSACGDIATEEIPATGHNYAEEFTIDTAATCTTVGSQSRHCTNADCDSKTDVTELPVIAHSYGEWQEMVAATCETMGSKEHTCSACGDIATEEIPATGHSYAEEFTVDTAATCTTVGSQSRHCTNADCDSKTDVTELPVIAHSYGEWQEMVAASCETAGSKERTCSACGDIATEEIPALGHSYAEEFTIDTVATCTTVGSQSRHCTNADCEGKADVTEIPALGHSYAEEFTIDAVATCTTFGSQSKHCTNAGCDSKTGIVSIPMLEHSYGEWMITTPAFCESAGNKYHVCSGCLYSEDVVIDALGHQDDGSGSCSNCGQKMIGINETNFPDAVFREYVGAYDENSDGILVDSELMFASQMNLSGTEGTDGGYTDLTGIQYFTCLSELSCAYNVGITSLDLSNMPELRMVDCSNTGVMDLNLNQCSKLDILKMDYTNISDFNAVGFDNLSQLRELSAGYAGLNDDNIGVIINEGLSSISFLNLEGNSFTELVLSDYTALTGLYIGFNSSLTNVDITACTELTSLNMVACTGIMGIDVSKNTKLTYLELGGCTGVSTLDVSTCTALNSLFLSGTALTTLDVSACTQLWDISISSTALTELDVSMCDMLSSITVTGCNQLAALHLTQNVSQSRTVYIYANVDTLLTENGITKSSTVTVVWETSDY